MPDLGFEIKRQIVPVRVLLRIAWAACVTSWLLGSLGPAWAQQTSNPSAGTQTSQPATPKAEDPLKRDSPQSCVASFLQACRAHDYTRACSYLDLRSLPHTARVKEGRQLAQQMEQVLDRDTRFDVGDLASDPKGSAAAGMPANQERVDSFNDNGQTVDIDLERIRLRSGIWIWVFSSATIARIPRLMRITSESPIEKYLPDPLVTWTLAGMPLWQWIALVLLALITAALAHFVCPPALRCTQPLLRQVAPHLDSTSLQSFIGPFRLLLAAVLFRLGMEWISPSPAVSVYLGRLLALLFIAGIFCLLLGIIDLGLVRIRSILQARRHIVSYSALPLAARVFKILCCCCSSRLSSPSGATTRPRYWRVSAWAASRSL